MALTPDQVRYVARLARLSFLPEEEEQLARDLTAITDYIQALEEVDIEGVEPLLHVLDRRDVVREDRARPRIGREEALREAPDTDGTYFRVPKVID